MKSFELMYENFRMNRKQYFILLKKASSSFSPISKVFEGYESCKENLIYLISEKVFKTLDKSSLPNEAKFLPITFKQFSDIIENSPEDSSLKVVESESLEIIIQSGDVKRFARNSLEKKQKKANFVLFCLLGVLLLCVLGLKGLYFYVSYILIFNLLKLTGIFAAASTTLSFLVLNHISDKLFDNVIQDFKTNLKKQGMDTDE